MVAIWSGWVSLGEMCGFGLVQPFPGIVAWRLNTAITFPVGVEAYGAYAMSALALADDAGQRQGVRQVVRPGRANARHARPGRLPPAFRGPPGRAPWPVVVAVACLPVITLGFGAALFRPDLLTRRHRPGRRGDHAGRVRSAYPGRGREASQRGAPSPPAGLLEQARAIDAEHRLANRGKPISRDNLKLALGIATDKATALVHVIRAEHDPPAATGPDSQQTARDFPRAA